MKEDKPNLQSRLFEQILDMDIKRKSTEGPTKDSIVSCMSGDPFKEVHARRSKLRQSAVLTVQSEFFNNKTYR